jgi:hypothetical protein
MLRLGAVLALGSLTACNASTPQPSGSSDPTATAVATASAPGDVLTSEEAAAQIRQIYVGHQCFRYLDIQAVTVTDKRMADDTAEVQANVLIGRSGNASQMPGTCQDDFSWGKFRQFGVLLSKNGSFTSSDLYHFKKWDTGWKIESPWPYDASAAPMAAPPPLPDATAQLIWNTEQAARRAAVNPCNLLSPQVLYPGPSDTPDAITVLGDGDLRWDGQPVDLAGLKRNIAASSGKILLAFGPLATCASLGDAIHAVGQVKYGWQ